MTITFEVLGVPQHQGSIRAFMPKGHDKPVLTSTNEDVKPWRQDVAYMAKEAMQEAGLTGCFARNIPLRIEANFTFVRPKSVKPSVERKTTRPDVDKTARALLDALTGIVYADDAQVSDLTVVKRLSDRARTLVRITAMEG